VPNDWVHSAEPAPLNALHSDLKYEIQSSTTSTLVPTHYVTHVAVFRDQAALYVEINALDATPQRIIAANGVHDAAMSGDKVQLFIDPLGTGRRAYVFGVSASGSTGDQIISSVGESSFNWNGQWESSAQRTSTGYEVRIRVPFQTIEVQENSMDLAINVKRTIGYDREDVLSWAPVDVHLSCEVCQFEHLRIDDLKTQPSQWQLSPYVVARSIHQSDDSTIQEAYAGLDMQWSKNGRKFVGTIRPDYLQLDFDNFQITANRRYAIYLSENRPFFTQDPGPFQGAMSLVYTRAITDLDWGAQYVQRQADQTFGVMVAKERYTNIIRPEVLGSRLSSQESESTNAIVSYGQQINDKLRLGTLATLRTGEDYQNTMFSGSLRWEPSAENSFVVEAASSQARDPANSQGQSSGSSAGNSSTGNAFYLNHSYTSGPLYSQSTVTHVSENFRADLGSIGLAGGTQLSNTESWSFDRSPQDFITSYGGTFLLDGIFDVDNNLLERELFASATMTVRSKNTVSITKQKGMMMLDSRAFMTDQTTIDFTSRLTDRITIIPSVGRGTTTDFAALEERPFHSISVLAVWKMGAKWMISSTVIHETDINANYLGYRSQVVNVRLSYSPTNAHTLRLQFGQSSTLQKDLSDGVRYEQNYVGQKGQIVYTWNPRIGTTLVLGWQGNRTKTNGEVTSQTTAVFGKLVKAF
jgi:hypothetical protein